MWPDVPYMWPDVPYTCPDVPYTCPDVPYMWPDVPYMWPDVPYMWPDVRVQVKKLKSAGDHFKALAEKTKEEYDAMCAEYADYKQLSEETGIKLRAEAKEVVEKLEAHLEEITTENERLKKELLRAKKLERSGSHQSTEKALRDHAEALMREVEQLKLEMQKQEVTGRWACAKP
jgi:gas vesicle protein